MMTKTLLRVHQCGLTVKNGSAPISKEEEAMKEYLSSIQDVLNEKKTSEEGLAS